MASLKSPLDPRLGEQLERYRALRLCRYTGARGRTHGRADLAWSVQRVLNGAQEHSEDDQGNQNDEDRNTNSPCEANRFSLTPALVFVLPCQ